MKKNILKAARTLCLSAAHTGNFVVMCAMMMVLAATSSCNKDEDGDGGTYTPTANDDLKQLIKQANAKLFAERQITWTITSTHTENGQTVTSKEEVQYNHDSKKSLIVHYSGSTLVSFSFVDNDKKWEYTKYKYVNNQKVEIDEKQYYRPSITGETGDLDGVAEGDDGSNPNYTYSYKLSGDKIVVTRVYHSNHPDSSILEVELRADKRYKSVKTTYYVNNVVDHEGFWTYSYSNNPTAPMNTSDFTDSTGNYIGAKVIWNQNMGESMAWTKKCTDIPGLGTCTTYLYGSHLAPYAPDVAGKEIAYFTVNGSNTNYCASSNGCSYDYSIPLNNDGSTVITAAWKEGTTGAAPQVPAPMSRSSRYR